MWDIPNPETVAEHTIALRELACKIKPKLGLGKADFDRLLDMLEVHAWGESIIGDIADPDGSADKSEQERAAMQEICNDIGKQGEYILHLFDEHALRKTAVANIAFHIDKIQADIKAVEYEKEYEVQGLAWEFLNYDRDRFTLPLFRNVWQELYDNPAIYRGFTR